MRAPSSCRNVVRFRNTWMLSIVLALSAGAHAQYTPSDDANTTSAKPTANFGTAATINVQSGAQIQTGYLRFDLSGIPATFGPNIAKKISSHHALSENKATLILDHQDDENATFFH